MKKVKVIFPDGSTADIDESDLQSALNGGAKLYKESAKKQVKFQDGSIADLDENDANSAISGGATLVKKKDNALGSVGAKLGGTSTTLPSNGQLESPNLNDPFSFKSRNVKGVYLANFKNDPSWKPAPEPVKTVGQLAPKNPFALPDKVLYSPDILDSQELQEYNSKANSLPIVMLDNNEKKLQIVKDIVASRENDAVMRERAKSFIVSDAAKNNIQVDPNNLPDAEEYFKNRREDIIGKVQTLQSELSDLGAQWGENLYSNPDAIKKRDQIAELDKTFGEVRKYSNWAVKDQVKKIDPKDYPTYSDYLKAVGMKVNSVDNYTGVKKKEESVLNGSDALKSKEIRDKENYNFELTGIEALQSNIINDFNEGKIDEDAAKAELGKLTVNNQTLETRYPEAAIDNLRKYLGDYIAQKRKDQDGNLKQTWHNVVSAAPSEEEIITAIHELRANDGVEITDDQEKKIAAKPDKIPLTSMIGHVYKNTILKGAQTLNSIVGADNEERKLDFRDPTMYQPVQPGEVALPTEVGDKNIVRVQANPNAGKHADVLSWATANSVSDVAGTIASFIGLNKIFGAIASKALGGIAGAETVGMTTTALGELKPITALTAAQTNLAANVLSATYLNYYDKLDASKALTDDPVTQKAYALSSSIITGLVFSEINPGKIFSVVAGAEEKAMGQKFIDKLLQGKGTLEPEKLKPFFAEWATNTAKDLGHNLTLVKANQIADIALDRLTNKNALVNRDVMDEMFGSLPADVISFLPFSAVVGYKQAAANTGIRNAIRMAITDPVDFENDMLKNVQTGKISPDDASQKINYVKGLADIYRGNDLNTEKLLSLTPEQRLDYANNLLRENGIKHNISKMTDELQIAGEKEKITALQEQRKSILESAETKVPDVTPAEEATTTDENITPVSTATNTPAPQNNKAGQDLNVVDTKTPDEITVGEMVDKVGSYKGERGNFFQEGQSLIFKVEGKNKEYELGNLDAIKNEPISSLDIANEQSVVNINDAGNIEVRGKEYANNFSDPLKAINYDGDGKVVSVNLENTDGKKRTFRGNIAEDIAYQINLKKITQDNESTTRFEEYINTPDVAKVVNEGLPAATDEGSIGDNGQVQQPERIKVDQPVTKEAKIINSLEGRKEVPGFELKAMQADPIAALQSIADQALGIGRDPQTGERLPLHENAPEPQLDATERKYGKEVVQKAIELYPAENNSSPTIKPNEKEKKEANAQGQKEVLNDNAASANDAAPSSNGLTKEAQDLISGIGEGSMPTFITKNLEKIATDNGVEITDKMTAADVVNALKEKGSNQKNDTPVKPISDKVKSKFDKLKNKSSETNSKNKQAEVIKSIENKAKDAEDSNDAAIAEEVIKEIDDLINLTPEQQTRVLGEKEIDGTVVKRQEPLKDIVVGKDVDILFTKDDKESGNYTVIERSELQPSHKSGVVNELHFIPEAQPRDRGGLEVLRNEAKNKSDKLDPNQFSDNNIAYFGAPVVNERGEVIQGNGRAEAIDYYYANDKKDSRGYKDMLQDKASSLGLDADAISKMNEPVLVKLTKANDERAIELGNYSAGELEDVKQKGADVKAAFNRLTPAKVEELASTINAKIDDTATLKQIIRDNVKVVLDKLFDLGALRKDNKEQYIKDGEVTPDGIQAAYDVVRKLLFEGGASDIEMKFDTLPFNTREAIEKTIPAILNNPELKSKVQEAIEIMRDQQGSGTDSFATWRIQRDIFGDQKMPSEKYEKELLDFAQGMSEAKTQKPIAERIIKLSKAMNETPADMFAEAVPAKRFDEAYNQPDIKFAISEKGSTEQQQMKDIVRDIQNEYADKDEPITLDEIKEIAKSELGPEYNEQLVEDAYNEAGKESRSFKKATAIKNELAKRIQEFTGKEVSVLSNSDALRKKAEELNTDVKYQLFEPADFIKDDKGNIIGVKEEVIKEINDEKETITSKAKDNGTYLKAPNGNDTKLSPENWVIARTKRFKRWFGDWEGDPKNASKIVDNNGEPLLMYHASNSKHDIFDRKKIDKDNTGRAKGFHFSSSTFDLKRFGKNIYTVFLDVRHPKRQDNVSQMFTDVKTRDMDGLISRYDIKDTGSAADVVVYDPNQIKSTENVGVFSDNPSIMYHSPDGEILGFTHDGKIYLNGEHLNPNTPVHEAGHVWLEVAKEKMPLVYNRGRELVKGSTYLKKAVSNEFYQQEANKLPNGERQAYFEHEALAAAIGDKGAQFITEARRKSFIDWAKDLWTKVANAVGFKGITSREMENMTLDQFAKRAAGDILKGKEPVIEEETAAPEPEQAKPKDPVAGDATLLSHAGMQDIADDFDLADVQSKNPETDIKIAEDAAATSKAWHEAGTYAENINRLISEIEKGSGSNPVEKIILQQHIANVREVAAKIENVFSKEYDAVITELDRLKRAGAKLKSTAGATLRDTTVFSDADPTMADWMAERKEVLEVDELTNGQKEEIQNIWNEYETNLKTADEKVSKAEQEIEKLKAELATKTERQKRTHLRNKNQASLKTERENIIKSIQEKLKKARGETNIIAVPYAKELIAIAPDVSRLVTNLIDSGITKLADIVDNVHGTLVDAIPGITKRDVHNIIAGEYNKDKPTLTELQYAKKDVIEEAKLINKLEALQNGEFPKSERELRKRNKEITDLRNKIKEYRKYDQSARTPEQILNSIKKRNESRKKEIDEKIANKDFSTKKKPVPVDENKLLKQANPQLWNETMDAINAKEESGNKFELLKRKDELAKRGALKKYLVDPVGKAITTAKAIKAGIDDSVTMVQLMMAVYSNPKAGIKAKISAFQDINNTHFKRELAALHNSVYWPIIEGSKLDITEPQSFGKKEVEELYSGNLLDDNFRIPFTDKKINPWTYTGGIFERIFTSMGNNLRLNLFYNRIAMLEGQGKTFDSHPEEYRGAARAINELTGRGKVADKLQTSMEAISPIIWAPKMLASTFNTLGITDVVAAFRGKKGVYREIPPQQARYLGWQMAKGIGMGVGVMAALAMRGWTIDKDPRSNTFGNVTTPDGNRKYNVFGRFGSLVKNLVQLAGGTKISSTGQEIDIDKSMGGRGKTAWTFVRGKMTPATGIFADYWLNNKTNTFTKQPINLRSLPNDLITPISFSALSQGLHNDGTMGLLNRFLPELEGIQVSDKRDYKTISTSLPDRSNKFLDEHGIPPPYFNPKQIEVKQMKAGEGSVKKLSDFDEETQVKYEKTHSQVFDQELSRLKNSFVFKDAYGNISLNSDDVKDKKVWVKKLDEKGMKKFISIINAKATEKTKQLLFKEYQK